MYKMYCVYDTCWYKCDNCKHLKTVHNTSVQKIIYKYIYKIKICYYFINIL